MCYSKIMNIAQRSSFIIFQSFNYLLNSSFKLPSKILLNSLSKYIHINPQNSSLGLLSPKSIFILIFIFSININLAHATLTATTANTIEGTKPKLVQNGTIIEASLADIVSVIEPENSTKLSPGGTLSKTFTSLHKLSDVKPYIAYYDSDGDREDSTYQAMGLIDGIEGISYVWKDKNNRVITNLDEVFSSCLSPYTLTVEANNAKAISSYGAPLTSSVYGSLGPISYMFTAPSGAGGCIKYLAPASMMVYTGKTSSEQKYNQWGYNSAVWESGKGFKIESTFPTTGFYKASFNIIGSNSSQSNYRCTKETSETRISLSGAQSPSLGSGCTVTYESRTKDDFTNSGLDTPTINLEYRANGSTGWVVVDSFTIPTPTLWARVKGPAQYNTSDTFTGRYPAAELCGMPSTFTGLAGHAEASKYFFTRRELTNAPQANGSHYKYIDGTGWKLFDINDNATTSGTTTGGYFSRDIGTFMGEWGQLFKNNESPYTYSGFQALNSIWPKETRSSDYQFYVYSYSGEVTGFIPSSSHLTVCR